MQRWGASWKRGWGGVDDREARGSWVDEWVTDEKSKRGLRCSSVDRACPACVKLWVSSLALCKLGGGMSVTPVLGR